MAFRDRPWRTAIPDLVAFVLGLGVAYVSRWSTADLVWSLWLSSLVVGYALIVWVVVEPALELAGLGWQHRGEVHDALATSAPRNLLGGLAIALVLGALWVGFFTLHFGGFHFIQASFLLSAWPLGPAFHTMNRVTLAEVFHRYWSALPAAFLARRHAFAERTFTRTAARRSGDLLGSRLAAPYVQVFRMHVVIIALGGAHALGQERFGVFAAIYAVYFFPFRLFRRQRTPQDAPPAGALGASA